MNFDLIRRVAREARWRLFDAPYECQYRGCREHVESYTGISGGSVFCSDEHAALDQEEAAL